MKLKNNLQNVVNAYNSGMTIEDIANQYGVVSETINKLLVGETYGGLYKTKEKDYRSAGKPVVLQINGKPIKFKSTRALSKVLGLSECHVTNILAGRHPIPIIEEIRYA